MGIILSWEAAQNMDINTASSGSMDHRSLSKRLSQKMNHFPSQMSLWAEGSTGLACGDWVMRARGGLPVARGPAPLGNDMLPSTTVLHQASLILLLSASSAAP